MSGVLVLIRSDVAKARAHKGRVAPVVMPNLVATSLYRIGHRASSSGHRWTARLLCIAGQVLTGAELHPQATIGPGFFIEHTTGVLVGPGVVAGRDLVLFGQTLLGAAWGARRGFPTLGDGVQVYAKASVLGAVSVGDGVIVGAHALVLHDVPAGAVVKGAPAC